MVALLALAALLPAFVSAASCVQFDADMNLYAFGGEKDYKFGQSSSFGNVEKHDLKGGDHRPPFSGHNMQCFLAQKHNAMYVVNSDEKDPGAIYVYDFAGDSWSKQGTLKTPFPSAGSRSSAAFDQESQILYTFPGGDKPMWILDLSNTTNHWAPTPAIWTQKDKANFKMDNYAVTAAIANGHINYFGVPETGEGEARIFDAKSGQYKDSQKYNGKNDGKTFPNKAGQATSITLPKDKNLPPQQMLYVPEDFSNTYVVTHWTNKDDPSKTDGSPMNKDLINTAQVLPPPTCQDKDASYACAGATCAQVDKDGNVYYINAINDDYTVKGDAKWIQLVNGKGEKVDAKADDAKADGHAATVTVTQTTLATTTTQAVATKTAGPARLDSNATYSPEPTPENAMATPGSGASRATVGIFGIALSALAIAGSIL